MYLTSANYLIPLSLPKSLLSIFILNWSRCCWTSSRQEVKHKGLCICVCVCASECLLVKCHCQYNKSCRHSTNITHCLTSFPVWIQTAGLSCVAIHKCVSQLHCVRSCSCTRTNQIQICKRACLCSQRNCVSFWDVYHLQSHDPSGINLICWFGAQVTLFYQCWKHLCCFTFLFNIEVHVRY